MENETVPVTVEVPVPTEAIIEAVQDAIAETLPDAVAEALDDTDETEDDFEWLENRLTEQCKKVDQLQVSLSAVETRQTETLELLTRLSERIPERLEPSLEVTNMPNETDLTNIPPETQLEIPVVTVTETVIETPLESTPVEEDVPSVPKTAPAKRFRRI